MSLWRPAATLLGVAAALAVVRHTAFAEEVLFDPAGTIAAVEKSPVIVAWTPAMGEAEIRSGRYQPVDLRRNSSLPFVAGQVAWRLPLPNSLQILARYEQRAKAERLVFLLTEEEREEGLRVARQVCERVGVREAALVVGNIGP